MSGDGLGRGDALALAVGVGCCAERLAQKSIQSDTSAIDLITSKQLVLCEMWEKISIRILTNVILHGCQNRREPNIV